MAQKNFSGVAEKLKDLPVSQVAQDVVDSVADGKVTILTAATGSGKTLLANSMLADASDHQVVVLVPRRFLAINAAETVAQLAGVEPGREVGFAIGRQLGDESQFSRHTKLLFTTYGYAMSSGLINTAKTIVADEVHEAGIDTSIARAVLHERMQKDPSLRVVEMSATIDAKQQAGFWSDIAKTNVLTAEGTAKACDFRHVRPDGIGSLERTAVDLIAHEGRKGVAIFRNGLKDINQTVDNLRQELKNARLDDKVEVARIYGEMDAKERAEATRPPAEGKMKILVGTNVIESGVNIMWLDAGVSDGTGKVPYYRKDSGADALVVEDLPQWRITQQIGRTNRSIPSIFILHAEKGMDEREERSTPEIERISPMHLVMHAAKLNLNPMKLKYDAKIDKNGLKNAKKDLQRLQLLNDDWTLTGKGQAVSSLPLSPETGAMIHEAGRAGVLTDTVITMAAIIEVGGIRADYRQSHGMEATSDIFDAMKAYRVLGDNADEDVCDALNVSVKRYRQVRGLINDLHRRVPAEEVKASHEPTRGELHKIMLHGSVNRLFEGTGSYRDLLRDEGGFEEGLGTAVSEENRDRFAIGQLREIPYHKSTRVVLTNITKIPRNTFLEFAAERGDILTDMTFGNETKKGKDSVTAGYFGGGKLTFAIPEHMTEAMETLIEPDYSQHALAQSKPAGQDNKKVREIPRSQIRPIVA